MTGRRGDPEMTFRVFWERRLTNYSEQGLFNEATEQGDIL